MKLYMASFSYDYEGGAVVGVFDSKEKAQKALKSAEFSGDEQRIEEIELNEEMVYWI